MTVRAPRMTTPKKTTTANLCPDAKLASPKTANQMMSHNDGTLVLSACVDGAANGCSCVSDDPTTSARAAGCFSAADSDTPCGTTGVRAACTSAAPCTAQLSMGSQDEMGDETTVAARMHGTSHRKENILKLEWQHSRTREFWAWLRHRET